MRMRELGQGQSVMFMAPVEVDRSIKRVAGMKSDGEVKVLDIIRWTMLETTADIQHHLPHWAHQGARYEGRKAAWPQSATVDALTVEALKPAWLQIEARSLQSLYGLRRAALLNQAVSMLPPEVGIAPDLRRRCEILGVVSLPDERVEEEQEREVNHEVEMERQIERPPKATPAEHQVPSNYLRNFIRTGVIPNNSPGFVPVFSPLYGTSADPGDRRLWSNYLLATKDFSTTISRSSYNSIQYLRPVNWIVSSETKGNVVLVVFSPWEINELLPKIRQSTKVHLHLYSPRVAKSQKSFEDLKFYCIPRLPASWKPPSPDQIIQLNIWAGQLYLPHLESYVQICKFFGICTKEACDDDAIQVQPDGFILPRHRQGTMYSSCRFTESPLPFLKEIISLRRKGMSFLTTHMGKITHARFLHDQDFIDIHGAPEF